MGYSFDGGDDKNNSDLCQWGSYCMHRPVQKLMKFPIEIVQSGLGINFEN